MKKFKLYGKKDNFEGILATIYVKDNKVVVESPDKIIKEILETEINKEIKENSGLTVLHNDADNNPLYLVNHYYVSKLVKINDDNFLEAVRSNSLTQDIGTAKSGKIKFGFCVKLRKLGYQISYFKSLVIEE